MHAAIKLGVTQRALETEYYLVDIPLLLRYKSHEIAEERLVTLQSLTVAQTTDKDVYERYLNTLREGLFVDGTAKPEAERLDRSGLDSLRNKIGRR